MAANAMSVTFNQINIIQVICIADVNQQTRIFLIKLTTVIAALV
jgi:hypothetical protein